MRFLSLISFFVIISMYDFFSLSFESPILLNEQTIKCCKFQWSTKVHNYRARLQQWNWIVSEMAWMTIKMNQYRAHQPNWDHPFFFISGPLVYGWKKWLSVFQYALEIFVNAIKSTRSTESTDFFRPQHTNITIIFMIESVAYSSRRMFRSEIKCFQSIDILLNIFTIGWICLFIALREPFVVTLFFSLLWSGQPFFLLCIQFSRDFDLLCCIVFLVELKSHTCAHCTTREIEIYGIRAGRGFCSSGSIVNKFWTDAKLTTDKKLWCMKMWVVILECITHQNAPIELLNNYIIISIKKCDLNIMKCTSNRILCFSCFSN